MCIFKRKKKADFDTLVRTLPKVIRAEFIGSTLEVEHDDGTVDRYYRQERMPFERGHVWLKEPFMERATFPEMGRWLDRMVLYNQRWGGPYPTAHLDRMP